MGRPEIKVHAGADTSPPHSTPAWAIPGITKQEKEISMTTNNPVAEAHAIKYPDENTAFIEECMDERKLIEQIASRQLPKREMKNAFEVLIERANAANMDLGQYFREFGYALTERDETKTETGKDAWPEPERDIVDMIFQPRIEAILHPYQTGFATEAHTVKAIRALGHDKDIDCMLRALVRICNDRDKQITYLAEDYVAEV